jgi:hypothetical protein
VVQGWEQRETSGEMMAAWTRLEGGTIMMYHEGLIHGLNVSQKQKRNQSDATVWSPTSSCLLREGPRERSRFEEQVCRGSSTHNEMVAKARAVILDLASAGGYSSHD